MNINIEEVGILLPQIKQKVQEAVDIANASDDTLMQIAAGNLLTILGTLSDPQAAVELFEILQPFCKRKVADYNASQQ